uniref:Uncharacterized protein n=1 Tax=Fagus sylvatica TaxID=28930 RepID=A0A2N9EKW6_FAGSY
MLTANSTEQQGMEMVATVISDIECKLNTTTRGGNVSNSGRISDVNCKLNRTTRGENGDNSNRDDASARRPSISAFGGGADPASSASLSHCVVTRNSKGN